VGDALAELAGRELGEGDRRGAAPPASSITTRPASSDVFPVPAAASTSSVESSWVNARRRSPSSSREVMPRSRIC